ncbi:CHAD domain-containing protein [Mycobacterium kyorinense]|uniref:CHAD domain-containing protein n=1 Tax=Mycobacterium kyorinense TaxID=487514 RepID=A0A1A2Z7L3_9MYCO|nr:CYTH and CHAD domain-containing protein [Mycobacterium kyorinense]OBI46250.1 CHAD domain-containing protein [Mycobacterium kyorinense]
MAVKAPDTSRYLEVERKFDVVESTSSPSFGGITAIVRVDGPPAQTLDAVYFDTPERDLATKGITLRRRTGGTDAGWHLKLPAGPDARTEVRASLDAAGNGDGVPADLVDVVLGIVRDRPLRPVARISTTRKVHLLHGADGVLAEFCDDRVTARLADESAGEQRWREWELELVGSDAPADIALLDRLSNRLLGAGATPARHVSKLARALNGVVPLHDSPPRTANPVHRAVAEQIDELLVWDRAVRADAPDAVHQMRVTTRKIRSLLRATPDSFGLTDNAWILDELRELGRVLGTARDAEVLAERYQQALDSLPPHLVRGRVRERLVDDAQRQYRKGLARSLIALRSQRYFRLLDALEAVVAEPTARADQPSAPVTIEAAYKRVRKASKRAADASEEDRDDALHGVRKKTKRLRYTATATGAGKISERAKAIQTLLGDHQDSVVSRSHLQQQAAAAHAAGEDTFTYGLLYQQEAELAQRRREQLDKALRKLDKAARKTLR